MDGRPQDGPPDFGLPAHWAEPLARAAFTQQIGVAIALDAELRVLAANLGPDELPGVPIRPGVPAREVFAALGAPDAVASLERVLDTGEPLGDRTTVLQARRADLRRPVYLRLGALRIGTDTEPPHGVLVVLTDVTDGIRANTRLELTRAAALTLGASLDVTETAQQLADLFVPSLADLAAVHLADAVLVGEEPPRFVGGQTNARRVAVASHGKPWPASLLQPGEPIPELPDIPEVRSFHSGETVLIPDLAEHLRTAKVVDMDYRDSRIPEDAHSIVAVPLVARGLVLGGVQLWRTDRTEAFDEHDARVVEDIVSRAALSVDNARRYT
ncbi:MAG TPA: GAF domain-containing protein, partial [Yinghuangia sp.]|nr:GAF domain-containing protein [Yinghuangia sp.]